MRHHLRMKRKNAKHRRNKCLALGIYRIIYARKSVYGTSVLKWMESWMDLVKAANGGVLPS